MASAPCARKYFPRSCACCACEYEDRVQIATTANALQPSRAGGRHIPYKPPNPVRMVGRGRLRRPPSMEISSAVRAGVGVDSSLTHLTCSSSSHMSAMSDSDMCTCRVLRHCVVLRVSDTTRATGRPSRCQRVNKRGSGREQPRHETICVVALAREGRCLTFVLAG